MALPLAAAAIPLLKGVAGKAAAGAATKGAAAAVGKGMSGLVGNQNASPGGAGVPGTSISPQAGLSAVSGLFQNIQANKLKREADAAMPPEIDPRQSSFLAELNQKRKAIDTGADFAAGMQAIDQSQAGTQQAITRATGGDVGGAIQGLLQAQRGAARAKNQVLAQGQGQQMAYNRMFGDLTNKIAARQLQIQMQRAQQKRAEWAQKKQIANQNTMAGLARGSQEIGDMLGGSGPEAGPELPPGTYNPNDNLTQVMMDENQLINQPQTSFLNNIQSPGTEITTTPATNASWTANF